MFTAYIEGLKNIFKNKGIVVFIYITTLLLSLLVAIPFFSFAKANFSDSLLIRDLLSDFDFTAYKELTNNYKSYIPIFITIIKWLGIGYLLFSVLLSGGIISTLIDNNSKYSLKSFLKGCGKYFSKFSKLYIYLFILHAILFIIFAIPYSMIISSLLDSVQSEATLVYFTLAYASVYLSLFTFIFTIGEYSKISLVQTESKKVLKSIWINTKYVIKHFSSYILYLLTLIFPLVIILAYFLVESLFGMTSIFTIVVMILIQQSFIISRIAGKIWITSSAVEFYKIHQ